ncbi:helix-turn-helix domain-containing protein [Leucobacter coleopterorum]
MRREIATQLRLEGLNNAQIARLLGVNRSTVGRWELTEQEHIL